MGADLAERVVAGDRRAISRALTLVERGDAAAAALIGALFPLTGRAHLVGVTGAGGVGKSTLIAALIGHWRARGRSVGVVAVDPTSTLSGGALLGDRVRMEDHHADAGVWIRSLATRGASGGLARATLDAARVLDAAGFEIVVVETIGVGQDEVEVARAVETVLLVEAPNLGDDVQTLKAGLLEVADLIVVGKSDLPGADRALATLRAAFHLAPGQPPPLLAASAATGAGVSALADALEAHLTWLSADGRRERRTRARAAAELQRLLRDDLIRVALARLGDQDLAEASAQVASRARDPYTVARALLGQVLAHPDR